METGWTKVLPRWERMVCYSEEHSLVVERLE